MSDLIEREDAIKALRLEYPMMPFFKENRKEWAIKTEGYRKAEEVIMKLPSVDTPTTMTGVIDAIREAEYRGYMKGVLVGGEERPKGEWMPIGAVCEVICRYCIKANGYCQHHWKCPLLTEIAELIESKEEPQTCSFGLHMDCSLCWKESHCRAIKEAERKEREGE